jgi:hypothetical protein
MVVLIVAGVIVGAFLLIRNVNLKKTPLSAARAPGWYPDPQGAPNQQYWDGTVWTGQTRPYPSQ